MEIKITTITAAAVLVPVIYYRTEHAQSSPSIGCRRGVHMIIAVDEKANLSEQEREKTVQKKDWTQTISFGKSETPQQLRTLVSRPREAKKTKMMVPPPPPNYHLAPKSVKERKGESAAGTIATITSLPGGESAKWPKIDRHRPSLSFSSFPDSQII